MDIKLIKSIIGVFESSKLSKLEIEDIENGNGLKLKMEKGEKSVVTSPAVVSAAPEYSSPIKAEKNVQYTEGVMDFNRMSEIKSPMVGIFYTSNNPESAPYVTKGSRVSKGDTLCIIEAMKLMNEVVAERDGEIVEVVAKNGELVEFGQVLFRIL